MVISIHASRCCCDRVLLSLSLMNFLFWNAALTYYLSDWQGEQGNLYARPSVRTRLSGGCTPTAYGSKRMGSPCKIRPPCLPSSPHFQIPLNQPHWLSWLCITQILRPSTDPTVLPHWRVHSVNWWQLPHHQMAANIWSDLSVLSLEKHLNMIWIWSTNYQLFMKTVAEVRKTLNAVDNASVSIFSKKTRYIQPK